MKQIKLLLISICLVLSLSTVSKAEILVADLSDHLVKVTTGFTGADLILFGSVNGTGDVIVTVHGPTEEVIVRKKDQVSGIWVNTEAVTFEHVPSFYSVAATDQAMSRVSETVGKRHQIGAYNVRFDTKDDSLDNKEVAAFREALVRNKANMGLYTKSPERVEMRGKNLFRTSVHFPSNVPTGTYVVETLLMRDGEVIAAQNTPLFINKLGFGAQVFRSAHNYPALYGIVAIIIAVLGGLAANWIFKKLSSA